MSQLTLYERVKMTVSGTPGTGTFTLGSAVTDPVNGNYRSLATAGVPNAAVVSYLAVDGNNWEVGHGTYTSSGATLARSVIYSSNSNTPINASSNTIVSLTALANDYVSQQPMTVVFAAHDSLASAKAAAQFVCTGTADDVLINSVIATLTNGGTINFMNGTYNLTSSILIDLDWITLRGEGNQHWGGYITYYQGTTSQQSVTGAPGGAKFVQGTSSANGITIGTTLTQMHGTTGSGSTGDTRHKGISIEKIYLSGPGDQPLTETVTVSGSSFTTGTADVTFTSSALTGSPVSVPVAIVGTDTTTTIAAKIAAAVMANSVLTAAGISASSASAVCTILTSSSLIPLPTFSVTNAGGATFTLANPNPSYGTGTGISDKWQSNSAGQKGFSDLCRITECSIFGFLNGIEVGWDTGHICDNNIQNIGGWGIKLEGINTVCRGNIVFDLAGPGIWVWPFQNGNGGHLITSNVIGDCGVDAGITIYNDVNTTFFSNYNVVSNNTITGTHSFCILIGGCSFSTFMSNIINKTFLQPISNAPGVQFGFNSNSCNNNLFCGNVINDAGVTQTQAAIALINNSTNNVFQANSLSGNWGNGGNNLQLNAFGGNIWGINVGQVPQYNSDGFQVVTGTTSITQDQVAIDTTSSITLTLPVGIGGKVIALKMGVAMGSGQTVVSASSNIVAPNLILTTSTTIFSQASGPSKYVYLCFDGNNWQVMAAA